MTAATTGTGEPTGTSEPTGTAATTTTTGPLRPTPEDVELLAFVQRFELTARDLYAAAIGRGADTGDAQPLLTIVRENHEVYANHLSGLLGVDAPQQRDDELYDSLVSRFESGDDAAVAEAGMALEATAVATNNDLIGQLRGRDGIAALASAVVIEARHYAALADLAGHGDDLDALLAADGEPLTPTVSGLRRAQ